MPRYGVVSSAMGVLMSGGWRPPQRPSGMMIAPFLVLRLACGALEARDAARHGAEGRTCEEDGGGGEGPARRGEGLPGSDTGAQEPAVGGQRWAARRSSPASVLSGA